MWGHFWPILGVMANFGPILAFFFGVLGNMGQ